MQQTDELNELKALLRESERIKSDLENSLLHDADRIRRLNGAYEQALTLARELENNATIEAERIIAEANEKKEEIEARIIEIENEINYLKEEIQFLRSAIESGSHTHDREKSIGLEEVKAFDKTDNTSNNTDNFYVIKLLAFLNARHYVVFRDKQGPVHAHSWQFKVDVEVPADNPNQIAFGDVLRVIKKVVEPYENSLLNEHKPFDTLMPTTENLAGVLFQSIKEEISSLGVNLARISVWESPTKGIEVTCYTTPPDKDLNYNHLDIVNSGLANAENVSDLTAVTSDCADPSEDCESLPELTNNEESATLANNGAVDPSVLEKNYSVKHYLFAGAIIITTVLIAYFKLLYTPDGNIYPWGSDTWAHLHKAEYLYGEIKRGNFLPNFYADWYNGWQPFRYWPPLSYYPIVAIRFFTGNIFVAGNIFIVLCAVTGSLLWLLFARRMGIFAATLMGIVWAVWPDNLNVAIASGNLPRALDNAILPILFFYFWRTIEDKKAKDIVITIILVHIAVLTHAMFAAIFCISLMLFSFFFFIFRGCSFIGLLRGGTVLILGIMTTAWWLLPSLSGGAVGIDAVSVKESVEFFSPLQSFNPIKRIDNIYAFYFGLSLLFGTAISFYFWKSKPAWAKSLLLCGLLLIVFTFPIVKPLYMAMPIAHLIWPIRFSSFAGMAILLANLSFLPVQEKKVKTKLIIAICVIFTVFYIDSFFSRQIITTKWEPADVLKSVEIINSNPGWKVATLDLSLLGSSPSYYFSQKAGREQVFGSSYQGAVTSSNIMQINTAIMNEYYPFIFRSLTYLGATDLVVKKDIFKDMSSFKKAAADTPYSQIGDKGQLAFWHGKNSPYFVEANNQCLVIGKHAPVLCYLFPSAETGRSNYIDDYTTDELNKYSMLVLSGAEWRSKDNAESLITQYALSGKNVFIDMTGTPQKVSAKQPYFMGIYGESISLKKPLEISGEGQKYELLPFSDEFSIWKCYVPQGLDKTLYSFGYMGRTAALLGYKNIGSGKAYFLGSNIIYHAFLSKDPTAIGLLSNILGLKELYPQMKTIPLTDYKVNQNGYSLKYQNENAVDAILPLAAIQGFKVKIDGQPVQHSTFENLIRLNLPAGYHSVEINLEKSGIDYIGITVSVMSIFLILLYFSLRVRRVKSEANNS
ncbi:MAG: hypothetical protein JL50_15135 [Peptococcaceae bacterium BICA1-7]|nr:MAG: hypothetical protein JL50_15135 [Peptococcaceae bacterium BICA1-7]HBV96880.1 hypothetical protein [Desulfotomaculum sp.]